MLLRLDNVETLASWTPHNNPLLAKHLCLIAIITMFITITSIVLTFTMVYTTIFSGKMGVVYYCFYHMTIIAIIFLTAMVLCQIPGIFEPSSFNLFPSISTSMQ